MSREEVGSIAGESHRRTAYRPDIDGLRAVAVLAVLAYHLRFPFTPGGFVGVDVFFVISGYLITRVIVDEATEARFSLSTFYERRIRRIFPALVVVLLAAFSLGLAHRLPSELTRLSESMLAALFSASNFYFSSSGDYFDPKVHDDPLVHTWSLAVEEQFYLLWPLLVVRLCRSATRHRLRIVLLLFVLSLVASSIGAFVAPTSTFYLIHSRAWELLLGALLPLGAFTRPLGAATRQVCSAVGILLIGGSVLLLSSRLPFPGLLAIPSCAGAFLLILAGRDGASLVGRLLSLRPVVFIGLISYSLYLWHWLLIVFQGSADLLYSGPSVRVEKLVIIGWSLLLATLSWKLVEQPFRAGRWRPRRRVLLRSSVVAAAAIAALGVSAIVNDGFAGRFTERERAIAAWLEFRPAMFPHHQCFVDKIGGELAAECLQKDEARPDYMLFGDSFAAHLWHGLSTTYPEINFLQVTAAECLPTVGGRPGDKPWCEEFLSEAYEEILVRDPPDRVIFAASWPRDVEVGPTLDWFRARDIPVTLVGPSPIYDSPFPRLLVLAIRKDEPGLPDRHWGKWAIRLDEALAATATEHDVGYVSPLTLLCPQHTCEWDELGDTPAFFDFGHLTVEGSALLARRIREAGLL